VAATFTQNAFPGAPVKLGRQRLREKQKIQATAGKMEDFMRKTWGFSIDGGEVL